MVLKHGNLTATKTCNFSSKYFMSYSGTVFNAIGTLCQKNDLMPKWARMVQCLRELLQTVTIAHIKTILGTQIISDGCSAYSNLENLAGGIFMHSTMVHQESFVDQNDMEDHKQNAENIWK